MSICALLASRKSCRGNLVTTEDFAQNILSFWQKFYIVKRLFQLFADFKLFNFPNLKNYDAFSQFV